MFSPLLLALAVLTQSGRDQVGPSELGTDEPPVRLWLNGDRRFEPGDRGRVQVEARDDGYLLVLNYDTDGRIRVLFPLDASDEGFVRGGRRYEVRGDRDRETFVAGDAGSGFVFVALAPDPWELRRWARGNGWDSDIIAIDPGSTDAERDLTRLVEGISSSRGFDYDLVEYFVDDIEVVQYEYRRPAFYGPGIYAGDPWCDPYWSSGWYCGGRSGLLISYGRYYRGDWWSIGYGPSWYWPYDRGYYYRPYSYGRGYTHYSYYRPWVVTGPTYRPGAVLVGRPRDYGVDRASPWSFDRARDAAARPAAGAGDSYRPRPQSSGGRARPVTRPAAEPEASRGRPAAGRPVTGSSVRGRQGEGAARPVARPANDRPSADRSPSSGRAPSSPQPRARARGGRGDDDGAAAAARSVVPTREPSYSRAAPSGRGSAPPVARRQPVDRGAAPSSARSAPPRSVSAPARAEGSRAPSRPSERPAASSRARGGRQGG